MNKAWAFYRRSTDKQELSIDDQRKACEKKAQELDCVIVKEFTPLKGFASGLTIEKDESFKEMVRKAHEPGHGIRYLLIYDVSRFGRGDPRTKTYFEEHFRRGGINIVYAAEQFQDDGTLGSQLTQFISHSEAHQYSIRLSSSTIRGSKSHALLGHSCGGRPPYGYSRLLIGHDGTSVGVLKEGQHKADKLQHVVWTPGSPQETGVIKDIFESYAGGNGLGTVRDNLNKAGVAPPRASAWSKHTILSMLKNPAYIGHRVYFKHNYHDRSAAAPKRIRSREEWVIKENAHEPIISTELFARVQARFHSYKPRDGRHYDSPYLLGGIVYCARCGHRYYGLNKTHKGKKTPYYLCGGYHNKGNQFCEPFSVPAGVLEKFAFKQIRTRAMELQSSAAIRARLQSLLSELTPSGGDERANALKLQIVQKKEEAVNIVWAIKARGGNVLLLDELERIESQRRALEGQLEALAPTPLAASLNSEQAISDMVGYMVTLPDILEKGTTEEKKALLKGFVDKVDISPEKKEATFFFHPLPFQKNKTAGPFGTGDFFRRDGCGGRI